MLQRDQLGFGSKAFLFILFENVHFKYFYRT